MVVVKIEDGETQAAATAFPKMDAPSEALAIYGNKHSDRDAGKMRGHAARSSFSRVSIWLPLSSRCKEM